MSKRLAGIGVLVLALLSANIARAQELTPADKERAMQYLENTKKNIVTPRKGCRQRSGISKPGRTAGRSPRLWNISRRRKT